MDEETKICGRCEEDLPLTRFYLCPTSVDKHSGTCMKCQKERVYEIREQRRSKGLTVGGVIPKWRIKVMEKLAEERGEPITASELAIERERHKRRVEKEIEIDLKPDPVPQDFESETGLSLLTGTFLRQGQRKRSWSCY